ncbi:MAG: flagellar biosynthesis protein FlhB [Sedimentisphaerales bacterium]|nr:flagellar biosynthesis protein FlhB [Sedimentisphaerales bacterium]
MPDLGEKTEAPTPRRLQEAREKGQVARSMDLSAALGLLAGLLLLNGYGSSMMRGFADLMQQSFTLDQVPTDGLLVVDAVWRIMLRHAGVILLPFFAVLVVTAIVVNLAQVGFVFSAQPITPSLDKLSPLKGFSRLFSRRTAIRFVMSLAKIIVIAAVAFVTIRSYLPRLLQLAELSFARVITAGASLVFLLGLRLAAVLVILALIDYAFQRRQWTQDLRMTKQEVKEELKRMEGDPLMRQRRLQVARQLAAQRMSQAVPKADVVITNPTELAIALKYDHEQMHAPKVVAKGAGFIAQRIRDIATEHGVPIVERKPLAQAMYKACEVGDYIPPELYKAVAEVLAYVFELAGKGYRRVATG